MNRKKTSELFNRTKPEPACAYNPWSWEWKASSCRPYLYCRLKHRLGGHTTTLFRVDDVSFCRATHGRAKRASAPTRSVGKLLVCRRWWNARLADRPTDGWTSDVVWLTRRRVLAERLLAAGGGGGGGGRRTTGRVIKLLPQSTALRARSNTSSRCRRQVDRRPQ